MKYVANPVEVDAFVILEAAPATRVAAATLRVGDVVETISDGYVLRLGECDGRVSTVKVVHADKGMCARMTPKSGDYWVVQSDGYEYLNPKEVFERKYSVKPTIELSVPKEAV